MRVTMIGTGYVGLVSGTCFADFGHTVICVDKDASKIDALNKGQIPIYEPGLAELVAKNVREERLSFTTDAADAIAGADAVFIAVGTPSRRGDGHADLSYVYGAAEEIAAAIKDFTVVVTKSTVPVGTGDEVEDIIRRVNPAADFAVVSNPEFLREGAAIEDFKRPDRIVVGTDDPRAVEVMRELYRPLYLNETPILVTRRRTSELIKYAANAFLAVKITFINEMADLCERTGADVDEVARGVGLDSRIGPKFLNPGPGFGGSCFPKDTLALARMGQEHGAPQRLVETTVAVNDARKDAMAARVVSACGGSVRGKTVALLGLTFKPGTDDLRESPALTIAAALQSAGARVVAYDPQGLAGAIEALPDLVPAPDALAAARGADALVLATEWPEFLTLDPDQLASVMKAAVVVDLRNAFDGPRFARAGFAYSGIGHRPLAPAAHSEAAE